MMRWMSTDAWGFPATMANRDPVGRATGGHYGFRIGKSLALAMLQPDLAKPGSEVSIEILGQDYKAVVIEDSPYDPMNERLRDVNGAND